MLVTWGRESVRIFFWNDKASKNLWIWRLAVLAAARLRGGFSSGCTDQALVDVRRFHHVALHVYLRMHKRSLTGKHHPKLSSYSWFCLKNREKNTLETGNEIFASLHHHALCRLEWRQFWDEEKLMAFGHDWIHSMQDYCPLDVQIIALLTQKTSYLIDFLCTIYFPCYG